MYTKQINPDGTASLNTYALQREVVPEQPTYITKEEFDSVIEQLKNALNEPKAAPAAEENISITNYLFKKLSERL